jgi:hypothetical protein
MSDEDDNYEPPAGSGEYSIEIPKFRDWEISKYYDYSDLSADFEDLQELNRQTAAARVALFKLSETINKAERKAKQAKVVYERSYRRKYIESSEKTETAKKINAEILVEDLENRYMYFEQLASELNRAHYAVRQELSALQAVGNNLRQQIKTV